MILAFPEIWVRAEPSDTCPFPSPALAPSCTSRALVLPRVDTLGRTPKPHSCPPAISTARPLSPLPRRDAGKTGSLPSLETIKQEILKP